MFSQLHSMRPDVYIRRLSHCLWIALIASVGGGAAYAQQAPSVPNAEIFYSHIEPLTDKIARTKSDPRPSTTRGALQALDWLIYGSVALGNAYDSNVNQSTDEKSANGARAVPAVVALRETGIHRTELYGAGDVRYYPSEDLTTLEETRAGAVHSWRIQPDFIYRIQGQVSFDDESSSESGSDEPVSYREDFGSTSIEKGFGRFFAAVGGSISNTDFTDSVNTSSGTIDEGFRDGQRYTLAGRLGHHISPFSYIFVEPSLEWQRYSSSKSFDSDRDQIVAGIGTGRISLFNGEIYAGYYSQDFADPTISTIDGPLYGGRISWFPTRFITVTAQHKHFFDLSDFRSSPSSIGNITENKVTSLAASWDVNRSVTLDAEVSITDEDFINSSRQDEYISYSIGGTYYVNRRFGIGLEYTYWDRDSNFPGNDYTRDFVSVTGKTRF